MNGIEKITERISQDTEQELRAILQDGNTQVKEITTGYAALADAEYDSALAQGKADAAERIERLGSVSQLEARKLNLAARQEMLGKAFDLALNKLQNLPEQDYVDLLSKLAVEGSTTGREALVLSVQDRPRFGKRVVVAANERLAAAGKVGELTLSEEAREFAGGLYVQDGNVETNCTLPTIVRMLRETMAGEVAEILFEN